MNVEPDPTPTFAELLRIVNKTVEAIEGADHAAVTAAPGAERLLAATSPLAEELENAQRESGDGPSVVAGRSGKIERINYLSDGVWPHFAGVCQRCSVHSVAAFPLFDGHSTIGVLTVYSNDHHAFGAPELRVGRAVADTLVPVVRQVAELAPASDGRRSVGSHG